MLTVENSLVTLLVCALLSAAALYALAIPMGRKIGLVDSCDLAEPARRTPLVGGPVLWLLLAVGWMLGPLPKEWHTPVALSGLCAVGVWDDWKPQGLGPLAKTLLTAGLLLLALLPAALSSWWLLFPAWFVLHAMNTSDNSNGLAGGIAGIGVAVLLASGSGWHGYSEVALALLGGALLAFFVLNFPAGRLFLGDSGSLLLGGIFAVAFMRQQEPAILCLVALPLADLLSVAWIRWSNGRRPWIGDRNHVSHRLAASIGASNAVMLLLLLQVLWSGFGWWLSGTSFSRGTAWWIGGTSVGLATLLCLLIRRPGGGAELGPPRDSRKKLHFPGKDAIESSLLTDPNCGEPGGSR